LPTNYLEYSYRDSFEHWFVILSDGQENGYTMNYPAAIILRNELPRRKQRGINSLQPLLTRAASCGELDPLSD
jgi:hypothetical protein